MKSLYCFPFLMAFVQISFFSFGQIPKYEFRGAWIASVDNIDWPVKGTFSADSQKIQYINMLDMHQRNGINAVIVQVRPATDAFYPSQYEPWSQWLTGKQGQPPVPSYDPLLFMIEESHKRGMEFHAWCNPYRADFKIGSSSIAPTHVTRIHPEWFLPYGDKRYFDPGNKQAQQFVVNVIQDIVKRYDVDALHFDDYFYPYRIAGKEFPDSISFSQYGAGMKKEDWRRSNVDSIIVLLGRAIKKEKPYCRFGISPFGVWRNKDKDPEGSDTKAGQTNYDDLYADILLWLKKGWIDYVAPQLYWEFGHRAAPYEVLLDWWSKHTYGKHCYIGLGIYRAGSSDVWKDSTLLPRQIQALRNYPQVQGAIYFSSKSFIRNPNGWNDSLQSNYYKHSALIPPMEWIDNRKPSPPANFSVTKMNDSVLILRGDATYKPESIKSMNLYISPVVKDVIARRPTALKHIIVRDDSRNSFLLNGFHPGNFDQKAKEYFMAATFVTRNNNESEIGKIITMKKNESGDWRFIY